MFIPPAPPSANPEALSALASFAAAFPAYIWGIITDGNNFSLMLWFAFIGAAVGIALMIWHKATNMTAFSHDWKLGNKRKEMQDLGIALKIFDNNHDWKLLNDKNYWKENK